MLWHFGCAFNCSTGAWQGKRLVLPTDAMQASIVSADAAVVIHLDRLVVTVVHVRGIIAELPAVTRGH